MYSKLVVLILVYICIWAQNVAIFVWYTYFYIYNSNSFWRFCINPIDDSYWLLSSWRWCELQILRWLLSHPNGVTHRVSCFYILWNLEQQGTLNVCLYICLTKYLNSTGDGNILLTGSDAQKSSLNAVHRLEPLTSRSSKEGSIDTGSYAFAIYLTFYCLRNLHHLSP